MQGLREWLNRNPAAGGLAAGGVLVVAVIILVLSALGGDQRSDEYVDAYLYDEQDFEAGGPGFEPGSTRQMQEEGRKQAVVFSCTDCSERDSLFVGYVISADQDQARLPGQEHADEWVSTFETAQFRKRVDERCEREGGRRQLCRPGR